MAEANLCRSALLKLHMAVRGLTRVKNGKTLFEMPPREDDDCLAAWEELNRAQLAAKIALDPDDENCEAGTSHWEAR